MVYKGARGHRPKQGAMSIAYYYSVADGSSLGWCLMRLKRELSWQCAAARLEGQPIHASETPSFGHALSATALSYR